MSKRNIVIIAVAIVVILVIAVIAVVAVVLTSDDDDKDNNTSETSEQSQDDTTSGEVKYKACELLNKADAEDILGNEVDDPTESNIAGFASTSNCTYITKYENLGDDLFTIGVLIRTSTKDDAQEAFESAKTVAYNSNTEDVDSLDVDAYWAPDLSQLSILKDDSWILVTALGRDDAHSKEISIEAADRILEDMD